MSNSLTDIRLRINNIDDALADLLCERANLAREVRRVKSGEKISTYIPDREKAIIDRVLPRLLEAGFSREKAESLFLSIISSCRSIVGDLEICFQGMPGSIHHAAAVKQFGPQPSYVLVTDAKEALARIESGLSQYAILPISRSGDGVSMSLIEMLLQSSVGIVAEREIVEEYSLYSGESEAGKSAISDLKLIYGDPEAIDIMRDSLIRIAPQAKYQIIPSEVTSREAMISLLKSSGASSALLAARGFSEELGLSVLAEVVSISAGGIDAHGFRSFYVLGKDAAHSISADGSYRTALVCACKDSEGALKKIIDSFSRYRLNLGRIESKNPRNAPWECMFFIEVEGVCALKDSAQEQTSKAEVSLLPKVIGELNGICTFVKVLGTYPKFQS